MRRPPSYTFALLGIALASVVILSGCADSAQAKADSARDAESAAKRSEAQHARCVSGFIASFADSVARAMAAQVEPEQAKRERMLRAVRNATERAQRDGGFAGEYWAEVGKMVGDSIRQAFDADKARIGTYRINAEYASLRQRAAAFSDSALNARDPSIAVRQESHATALLAEADAMSAVDASLRLAYQRLYSAALADSAICRSLAPTLRE